MKTTIVLFLLTFSSVFAQELSLDKANHLASLPLKCLQQEYPNKLQQLLINSSEIAAPKTLHPAFYGCFDWHSSVHGHWSLVYLLKRFPGLAYREEIINKLKTNLSKENIQTEINYLSKKELIRQFLPHIHHLLPSFFKIFFFHKLLSSISFICTNLLYLFFKNNYYKYYEYYY